MRRTTRPLPFVRRCASWPRQARAAAPRAHANLFPYQAIKDGGSKPRKDKGLSIAQWQASVSHLAVTRVARVAALQAAYRRYSVAAAIVGQLPLSASWAHGEIVAQVSHGAATHKRRANLGIIYDELCRQCSALVRSLARLQCASPRGRRSWAERMRSGEEGFCVVRQCHSLDTTQLRLVHLRFAFLASF